MAETEQKNEGQDAAIGRTADEKKKPNISLIVIGVLIFLLVFAVGGFIGYTQLPTVVSEFVGDSDVTEQKVKYAEVKSIMTLDPFTTNLAESVAFIRVTFQLGMADIANEDALETALVRDTIGSLLQSKTPDQILEPGGRDGLREEIRMLVNNRSTKNRVVEVYITDFVVQ